MKLIKNFKEMTKEEKKELAKKVAIGTGAFVTGAVISTVICKAKSNKIESDLNNEIDILKLDLEESENHAEWLEETAKKADKTYKYNKMALRKAGVKAMDEVYERDIAIMELVDGSKNKYRAARSEVWEKPEEHINKLDFDTERAYKAWVGHEQQKELKKQELF